MSYLHNALAKKKEELLEIIKLTTESLKNAPEGNLRISQNGKTTQYYYRSKDTDGIHRTGKYIKKQNIGLAYELAQRDYDRKILEVAKHRRDTIENFLTEYSQNELQEIYEQMNTHRKKLIISRTVTDNEYIKKWCSYEYKGKTFAEGLAEIYTEKGERVRSKSEKIIADMLHKAGISYRYECPITLNDIGTIYPDFTVLNIEERKEMYWEHFGMMDNNEYCEKALCKINSYIKNGIIPGKNLIITHETSKHSLETLIVEKMMREYLV